MSQPHLQIRVALLTDHLANGWMDGKCTSPTTSCSITAIGARASGTAVRTNWRRWSAGNGLNPPPSGCSSGSALVATSRPIMCRSRWATTTIAINNFIPTSGENKGKKLRRTKTRDYRIRLASEPLEGFPTNPLTEKRGSAVNP